MGTWSTSSRREASGLVSVQVSHSSFNNADMEVLSVGDFTYEFDIPGNDIDATSIGAIIGTCNIEVRDRLSNGDSVYDYFQGLSVTDIVETIITLQANSGSTYTFYFYSQVGDANIKEKSRRSTIKLNGYPFTSATIDDYYNGNTNSGAPSPTYNAYINDSSDNFYIGVTSRTFVEDVLQEFNPSAASTFVQSGIITGGGALSDGVEYNFVVLREQDQNIVSSPYGTVPIINVFANYAAVEGAIFGSAFNVNFYVRRNTTGGKVTLTYDDLEDLNAISPLRSFNTVSVSDGNTDPNTAPIVTTTEYNPYATQTFSFVPDLRAQRIATFYNNNSLDSGTTFIANSFDANTYEQVKVTTATSVTAYAKGLGADGSSRIEATIFGIDTLKPHLPFDFDSSVPARHQNKTFRISSATYSIMNDNIKIKAYQIA